MFPDSSWVLFTSLNRQKDLPTFKDALAVFKSPYYNLSWLTDGRKNLFFLFEEGGSRWTKWKAVNCHGLDFLVKHNIGSIEQALMVVKSPQNMECYKKRWFLAMEEFSFCYKASLGRFFLLKRSCRYMAFDIKDMKESWVSNSLVMHQ